MIAAAELIADGYRTASLRGADMAKATPLIEQLRGVLQPGAGDASALDRGFAASELLWRQIAAADDPGLIAACSELRSGLRELLSSTDRRRIRDGFAHGAEAGWAAWLRAFGAALGYFEMRHCAMLARELPALARELPDRAAAPPERVAQAAAAAQDLVDEVWERTETVFRLIAEAAEVDPVHRCKAWLSAAQVQIFLSKDLARAEAHIAAARALIADARVAKVHGELHLARGERDHARTCFDQALHLAPDRADGCLGMARLLIDDPAGRDLESAEQWSRQALQYRGGGDAYDLLIEIGVKRNDAQAAVDALVERVIRAEPERRARVWSSTCKWYVDEKQFPPAIRYADLLVDDGTNHQANLVLRGYLRCKTGELEGAQDDLFAALRERPEDRDALGWLHAVAQQLVEREHEVQAGKRVLDEVRRIVGESYDAEYRSQLERLARSLAIARNVEANRQFTAGRYPEAIALYDQAIELAPDPIYYANLAGAWTAADDVPAVEALEHALTALAGASRLAPETYGARLARLEEQRALVRRYAMPLSRVPAVSPIVIDVAEDIGKQVEGSAGGVAELPARLLSNLRSEVSANFGVRVPGVRMRGSELPAGSYGVMLAETLVTAGSVMLDRVWTSASPRELARHGVIAAPATHPRTGGESSWIAAADRGHEVIAGFASATPLEYLVMHVQTVVENNLAQFVGVHEVRELLAGVDLLDHLLDRLRERPGALAAFARALRGLVAEQVPISALRALWSGFEPLWQSGASVPAIIEQLRALPEIKRVLPANRDSRARYVLGDDAEAAVRRSIDTRGAVPVFAMEPELCQRTLSAVRDTVDAAAPGVIVCAADVRHFARKLVELEFPNLPVMSRDELLTVVDPAGVIDLHLHERGGHD